MKWLIRVVAMVVSVSAYGNPGTNGHCPAIGGHKSKCRLAKDCSVWYDLVTPGAGCKLNDGNPGICCPDLPHNGNEGSLKRKLVKRQTKNAVPFKINITTLEDAIEAARKRQACLANPKSCLVRSYVGYYRGPESSSVHVPHSPIRLGSPNALLSFNSRISPDANVTAASATPALFVAMELWNQFQSGHSEQQIKEAVKQLNLRDTSLSGTCPVKPTCSDSRYSAYRTIDGSCNNIVNSLWGKSSTQYQRLITPNYEDVFSKPRNAKNWRQGRQLPSARLVSISVVHNEDSVSDSTASWTMQMGQFLDHDLLSTPTPDGVTCCTNDGKPLESDKLDRERCFPIEIPEDDPFYSQFGQRCMDFVRSEIAPRSDCRFGFREQMNANTHFLDLSLVYGSDDKTAKELRTNEKGKLKISPLKNHHEKFLLPPGKEPLGRPCSLDRQVSGVEPSDDIKCFNAGDGRSSVTPSMAVSQTIFLREHNRLAEELSKLNSKWNDELLYQEARRILIAQAQHIIYNEWLPIVIGRQKMQQLGLLPLQNGFSNNYDANMNPNILNEFAGAAFRFGHSLVQGTYSLFNEQRQKVGTPKILHQNFFKSQEVYIPGNVDKFIISLSTTPIQNVDNSLTAELTKHLFENHPTERFGLDLAALNIQRGRDFGIPGYNSYRKLCGLKRVSNFDDLCETIPSVIVERFKLLYDSVDDIDLFIAGISERTAEGALVGPTFQCIIADQFMRLKRGDRFFYDLGGQAGSFTTGQLDEIRKSTLARLVCDNSNVKTSQPLIFKTPSVVNPLVDCNSPSIPRLNLGPFAVEDRWPHYNNGNGGIKWLQNCYYPGYDLSRKTIPGKQCGTLCINDGNCNAFTYSSESGICFLKKIPASQGRLAWNGAICGFLPWKF